MANISEGIRNLVRSLFTERDLTIATANETEEERIHRIANELVSGERSLEELTSTLDEFVTTTEPSPTTEPEVAPLGSKKTEEEIRKLFEDRNLTIPTGDETEEERIARLIADPRSLEEIGKALDPFGTVAEPGPLALPKGSFLVNVDGSPRLVWNWGSDLGFAWYDVTPDQIKNLYGDDPPPIHESFASVGSFEGKYGNFFMGNVAEIRINSEDAWQDLKNRIFQQFGFVPGMDDPQVKRLALEAFFEEWTTAEFITRYQQTDFFNSQTDTQREWASLSEAEKTSRTQDQAVDLVEEYRALWGTDPPDGINNPEIQAAARRVASGEALIDEWVFGQRREAELVDNTPAARDIIAETRAQGEQEVSTENLSSFAEDQYRRWLGPVDLPQGFGADWGNKLFLNEVSEADLETHLKNLASSAWVNKPPELTWNEWASPAKTTIRNTLELTSLDDNDPLLGDILNQGLGGNDLTSAIRHDERFLGTNRLQSEIASSVTQLGRQFGFIG